MRWLVVLSLLLASVASAKSGNIPRSGLDDSRVGGSTEPFLRCSDLPDPSESTTTLTTATSSSDLHEDIMAACSGGCIIEIGPGAYTENIVFGDTAIKADSVTPTGEVLIRASDPTNPPIIRAELGVKAAVIHSRASGTGIAPFIRVEDIILDGRRSEQTVASIDSSTICTDTTPDDDICDGSGVTQTSSFLHAFDSRNTSSGKTRSCLLRVQARETVGNSLQLSQAFASTVEDSTVSGAGCTTTSCPALSIPADATTNAILKTAMGIMFVGGSDSAAIENTIDDVTKIGIECFTNARRCHVHGNTITDAGIAGIVLNEGDGTVVGNTISDVGLAFLPNAMSNNVGQGIQFTNGDTYTGLVASITGNTVRNAFGPGIQVGLAGTAYNTARIDVSENSVSGTCNGGTRADSAGIELGDSTYDTAQIVAYDNSTANSDCVDGMRVRNVRTHRNWRNGIADGLEVDDVDEFDGISLSITGNLDIDSDTLGRIRTCSLTGTVVGSTNVQRQDCGEVSPPSGSSLWDTMVWGTDVWGS